jgi:hypothetical protein
VSYHHPVVDLAKARVRFRALMGEPAYDSPVYVGYTLAGQNIGLDPSWRRHGLVGPVCYWHVDDIRASLQALLDAGAGRHVIVQAWETREHWEGATAVMPPGASATPAAAAGATSPSAPPQPSPAIAGPRR